MNHATGYLSGNGTEKSGSLVSLVIDSFQRSSTLYVAIGSLLVLIMLLRRVPAQVDSREPPVISPRIPLIGHIIGLIRHQGQYLTKLHKSHQKLSIATLPMLNGKLYVIWDPALFQAAFRSKGLSFMPFAVEFAQRETGTTNEVFEPVRTTDLVPEFFRRIHPAMQNPHLHRMNVNALKYVSKELDAMSTDGSWLEIPNFYLWLRGLMSTATLQALFGPANPFAKDPSLVDDLWTFEGNLSMLLVNILPSFTAGEAHRARRRVQAALDKYYAANHDLHEDAAELTRARAGCLREYGIAPKNVGKYEIALCHVATTNTIPTLFWFASQVLSRPELVARLRKEALAAIQRGGDGTVSLQITSIEERCPLLVSCYREAIRVSNRAINSRRVIEDTVISDGKGNSYLLKKGVDIQLSAAVTHRREDVWGPDVLTFLPDRFLVQATKENSEEEKAKRAAFAPFGGGKHLCPGRNFAFAENLAFVVALVVGFDVAPLEGVEAPWNLPEMTRHMVVEAVGKPVKNGEGFGVRLRRKQGWESAKWRFT